MKDNRYDCMLLMIQVQVKKSDAKNVKTLQKKLGPNKRGPNKKGKGNFKICNTYTLGD